MERRSFRDFNRRNMAFLLLAGPSSPARSTPVEKSARMIRSRPRWHGIAPFSPHRTRKAHTRLRAPSGFRLIPSALGRSSRQGADLTSPPPWARARRRARSSSSTSKPQRPCRPTGRPRCPSSIRTGNGREFRSPARETPTTGRLGVVRDHLLLGSTSCLVRGQLVTRTTDPQ